MQVATQHARLVPRLEDPVRRVRAEQSGAVRLEEDGAHVATQPSRVGGMLSSQTGEQEADLGLLGVSGETDEGAADVLLELSGVLQVHRAAAGRGQRVVAAGGGEAGNLGAELLDGSCAEMVLLLHAAQVGGVVDAGAVGHAGDEHRRHVARRVESLQHELEVPCQLHGLVVRRGRGAHRGGSRRRRRGRLRGDCACEQEAAQEREETHFSLFFFFSCFLLLAEYPSESIYRYTRMDR